MRQLVALARRAARKPPRVIARRALQEVERELERFRAPRRERRLDERRLLRLLAAGSQEELLGRVASRPFPAVTSFVDPEAYERACPGDTDRILVAAESALGREIDLLGSGRIRLGRPIDWHADPTTGARWPLRYGPRLEYARLDDPCDVKLPWEISRLQWLIPAGQAYLLTREERFAAGTREIVEEWLDANPYPLGPNWAIAMEPAIRLVALVWLFQSLRTSEAWDEGFQWRVLRSLFLHADFVERHLELAEVNGNHLDADCAALVVAGIALGDAPLTRRWSSKGWGLLVRELPRQVTPDGVDFEASTAYHRLVTELFLLPAAHRLACGLDVPAAYRERLLAMAAFTRAYTRPDGTTPLWGDADDARVLPFGPQPIGDHRYLPALVEALLGERAPIAGPRAELAWTIGPEHAAALPEADELDEPTSRLFPDGGVAVMRGGGDHVFVDCGPVGLAGRGGHGHNDCLSLEAALDGVHLLTDCGSYVYTASPAWRDRFRSTAFHNTPQVDGEEVNRWAGSLWLLADDATPRVHAFTTTENRDLATASHDGYRRLASPVTPTRTVALDRAAHLLAIRDRFAGAGDHVVRIALHLTPGTEVSAVGPGRLSLSARGRPFTLSAADTRAWTARLEQGCVSPSYGVKEPTHVVVIERTGPLVDLVVALAPGNADPMPAARELLDRT